MNKTYIHVKQIDNRIELTVQRNDGDDRRSVKITDCLFRHLNSTVAMLRKLEIID